MVRNRVVLSIFVISSASSMIQLISWILIAVRRDFFRASIVALPRLAICVLYEALLVAETNEHFGSGQFL